MDTGKFSVPRATHPDVDEAIRLDAAAHPERTPSEHIAAAERLVAEEYRAETRRLLGADKLDDGEEE